MTPNGVLRTSPSAIARYFFHQCERFLRFSAADSDRRQAEGIPQPEFDHSPLIQAILESGYAWERQVLERLGDRVLVAPGDGELHTRRFDWRETTRLLASARPGTFLYQPTLHVPPAFYRRYGLDESVVLISDNHPDLVEVLATPAGRAFRVLDVKRGSALQLTHRVQVLLYALELAVVLEEAGVDGRADLTRGGVWLGGQPVADEFRLDELRPHLESFLRRDLVRILRQPADAAAWHVQFRCEWCEFFDHCRTQMQQDDDLSRIAHLTPAGKRFLRDRAGVADVAGLRERLAAPDADQLLARCASLAGRRPRLERQVAALADQQPYAHGAASPSLTKGENVGLFLTLQEEPLGRTVYLAGLFVTARQELRAELFSPELRAKLYDGTKPRPYVLVADRPEAVPAIRREWVRTLHEVLTGVHRYNQGRAWKDQLSLQPYVLTEQERTLLVGWLLEALRDPELAEPAMTLLFHFQGPDLMVADRHPDSEVPFPVIVLLDALGHVLALPVEVSYTLPESLAALGSPFKYRRNDYFHFPLGHGLRAEAIHSAWYRGRPEQLASLTDQAAGLLRAVWSLLQTMRTTAADALFAWPAKFALPAPATFADPLLSKLAFFARYESLLRCLETRHLRCEPRAVQLLLGQVMELEARSETELTVTGGAALPIEEGGFPEWLLVDDSEAGRRAQLEYRDYACRKQLWKGAEQPSLAVVRIDRIERDETGTPLSLVIEHAKPFAGGGPRPGQRLLLYRRFTDFTTDNVVEFLRSSPGGADDLFLRLLRDPATTAEPWPLDPVVESAATAARDRLGLTASQAAAYDRIRGHRATPVWGPPGTGKTHFLATLIRALADAHAASGRPFRVLVTAFTHTAIENLLRKLVGRARLPDPTSSKGDLAVAKVKAWQSDDAEPVEIVAEGDLADWLAERPHAVVGATVFSALKGSPLEPFDLVVIDEASQLRVPEAAVPVGLVAPHGRLILAGDHCQLPPIIVGTYPESPAGEPVLHRSIFEAVVNRDAEAERREPSGVGMPDVAGPGGSRRTVLSAPHDVRETPSVARLLENFRMNDVLTGFAARLLYGPDYRPVNDVVSTRRLPLRDERCLDPFIEACLDPEFPLVVVVLDGVWAARENACEARLVAQLVGALRENLRDARGGLYRDDDAFFRDGVFVVSPHRAQIRLIEQSLRQTRRWKHPPRVDTVDKLQGQEADAVIVSYGVSDPEFAIKEAEFIYGLERLNVALTRARTKCVVCLPRPLLDATALVLDQPEANRGLAFMRDLLHAVSAAGAPQTFDVGDGATATVLRANTAALPSAETVALPEPAPAPKPKKRSGKVAERREPSGDAAPVAPTPGGSRRTATSARATEPSVPSVVSTADIDERLARLNPPQREAACHGATPLLIVAGAGTGKTTTLVHRVAWLISQGVPAHRILLLTFTRRSADEMLTRVERVLEARDVRRRVWGGTFHAVATRLLRIYAPALGLSPKFTIHDRADSDSLLGTTAAKLGFSEGKKKFPRKGTLGAIHSFHVNSGLSLPEALKRQFAEYASLSIDLKKLFDAYTERKRELNVLDYDDLLEQWALLVEHPEAGPLVRGRFDFVLVDEFQDTNPLQARVLRGLRPDGRGLTVVGDDAQSIYAFRAATVRNILDFPKHYPGTTVITLDQNYRSTPPLLAASNVVIAGARERYEKHLWSERPAGLSPQLVECRDDMEQTEFVVGRILQHRKLGVPLREQAVLFRASQHSLLLEAALTKHDLPYVKYGGLKLTEAAHVKDLLSFLRLAENPRDTVAAQRVLCLLPGVGDTKAGQLSALLTAETRFAAWDDVKVPSKTQALWPSFVRLLKQLDSGGLDGGGLDLPTQIRETLAFYRPLLEDAYDNASQRLEDLKQLETISAAAPDRETFLADLSLDPPEETDPSDAPVDRLVLSTMHSAKGLEWKVVFVLSAVEGKIPHERAALIPEQLEEERRLFYVALTRAADWLYVCYPRTDSGPSYASWNLPPGPVERTRFLKSAEKSFQLQSARTFDVEAPPAKKRRVKS